MVARHGEYPLDDDQYKYQLNLIFKIIASRINPNSEYTLLGRAMIERFDELILEEIEPEFRDEIRNYFREYLINI